MKQLLLALTASALAIAAPEATIRVTGDAPGHPIPPTLFGIFFEEINRAGDGGLYAEMIENRSFEDHPDNPVCWTLGNGTMATLDRAHPIHENNPTALRFDGPGTVSNGGFKDEGIPVRLNEPLRFSCRVRSGQTATLTIRLLSNGHQEIAKAELEVKPGGWQSVDSVLTPAATDARARLSLTTDGPLSIDFVSLMPRDTWKGLPFRKDLAEMIAAMKPGFVRFPGGCFVEGKSQADAHRWKETIGDPACRKGADCLWGYHTTAGLGFHEFLLWCEALGAEPLYVINCGMSHAGAVPLDQMQPFVQDALDLVEYAHGPADSAWGAKRAAAGHPAPFRFNYLQIGNENGHKDYEERYRLFHDALKANYPDLKLIANEWDYTIPQGRNLDLIDEHYYRSTAFFRQAASMYDNRPRNGPGIYVGEYAANHDAKAGTLRGALADAAFMTGLERNCDLVRMASYAPLFCHASWSRWTPNAIYFDNARSYAKPAWHTQTLFGQNRGDVVLPCTVNGPEETLGFRASGIELATAEAGAAFRNVQVTGTKNNDLTSTGFKGWQINSAEFTLADGSITRTAEKASALAAVKAVKADWDGDLTITFEGRLSQDHTRSLGWKSGLRVNLFGGKVTVAFGNWGNQVHSLEGINTSPRTPSKLVRGQWHRFRIEVRDHQIRTFVDGQPAVAGRQQPVPCLFASAARSNVGRDLILKVVNTGAKPLVADIDLGTIRIAPEATGWVMHGSDPEATNTFENPTAIHPRPLLLNGADTRMKHEFPAWSLTVVRFQCIP